MENKEWYISAYAPDGVPTSDHLKLRSVSFPIEDSMPDHHVSVQILWLSIDPFVRTLMAGRADEGLYLPQFQLDQVIRSGGIGKVIKSTDSKYKVGDIVKHSFLPVAQYCVLPSDPSLRKIDPADGIPLPEYLSSLGLPGFTAWIAIKLLGEAKAGSTVFISAAAGAVGMFAGQLAKLQGCTVIGSTGSDDKVKFLKDEIGYDDAFNYKTETDFDAALNKYARNGIDLYLDNVGGKMLEAVLNHINSHGRIIVSGMISGYNKAWEEREGVRNLLNIVGKNVRMEGFLVGAYGDRMAEFEKEMKGYVAGGKIISKYMIYHGFDSFLESFGSIFSSKNTGKVLVQVS